MAAQHQVQLQCLQLAQQEAQVTAERQRVRAAQAEQIQRLSGKPLSGCGCTSPHIHSAGMRHPSSVKPHLKVCCVVSCKTGKLYNSCA